MPDIVFSPLAISDLEQAKEYISKEHEAPNAAEDILREIFKSIRKLKDFPKLGPELSCKVGFDTYYRYLVCNNYTVFYRLNDNAVHIVRVLHNRRNYVQILFES